MKEINQSDNKFSSVDSNPTKVKKTITINQNSLIYIIVTIILVILGIMGGIIFESHNNSNKLNSNFSSVAQRHLSALRHSKKFKNANIGIVNAISGSSITILDRNANLKTYIITSNTKIISETTGQTVNYQTISSGDRVYLKTISKFSKTLSLIIIRSTSSTPKVP